MVEDTLAAAEALRAMPWIDRRRIYLLGYGTGAMTALHAAALDDRIAGVVSVAGFNCCRANTVSSPMCWFASCSLGAGTACSEAD